MLSNSNPWESEDKAELVSIGTHHLYVSATGPPRKLSRPVVIFFSGGGTPCAMYVRSHRHLSNEFRVYFYDRTGYHPSERGPTETLTAQDAAQELIVLMERISVPPPYILLGHSYGCVIARALLDVLPAGSVTGMVLDEAATELMYHVFPGLPNPAYDVVTKGIDSVDVLHLREKSQLTDEEWQAAVEAGAKSRDATEAEDNHASGLALARRQQFHKHALDPWPLVVTRCSLAGDFRAVYNAGVEKGQGTEQERAQALEFVERFDIFEDELKAGQLRLSHCHKYMSLPDRGHNNAIINPETTTDAVRWVMERQNLDNISSKLC